MMARLRAMRTRQRRADQLLAFTHSIAVQENAHRRAIRPHVTIFDQTAWDHGFIPDAPSVDGAERLRRTVAASRLSQPLRGAR